MAVSQAASGAYVVGQAGAAAGVGGTVPVGIVGGVHQQRYVIAGRWLELILEKKHITEGVFKKGDLRLPNVVGNDAFLAFRPDIRTSDLFEKSSLFKISGHVFF